MAPVHAQDTVLTYMFQLNAPLFIMAWLQSVIMMLGYYVSVEHTSLCVWKKKSETIDCHYQHSEKKDPKTQEIQRKLFNWMKQDKMCKFLRKSLQICMFCPINKHFLNLMCVLDLVCELMILGCLYTVFQLNMWLFLTWFYCVIMILGYVLVFKLTTLYDSF